MLQITSKLPVSDAGGFFKAMETTMTAFSTLVASATSSLGTATFAPTRANGDLRQPSERHKTAPVPETRL
ncbi:hypothetical protein [Ensifer aridi]|uniref:hypothetical protein n=1 Tax=Ensifer aridi TaxID=1708715 RepID=UPI000A10EECE|nr:hypothetical protein [Ensifer aridi]